VLPEHGCSACRDEPLKVLCPQCGQQRFIPKPGERICPWCEMDRAESCSDPLLPWDEGLDYIADGWLDAAYEERFHLDDI
jgi:hypothetical protein